MTTNTLSRRRFVKGSASALALMSFPSLGIGQTAPKIRLEWQQFKATSHYASFYNAIRTMRANTKASNRSSWQFWTNVHVNYCPHGLPYFLAWHRGYIYYFEQQLRTISGDVDLTLPYWDYYTNPTIPSEFTDPASNNPLYVQRAGTSVYNALDLSPFAPTVYNFQRGTNNAFEPMIESAPHNPVHNLIGGIMATMQSPQDPIFYLHHANIDRLWHAWALPDGKGIPSSTSSYFSGSFTYASNLTLAKSKTYYPGWLGYDYANDTKPVVLPPQAKSSSFKLVQAQMTPALRRPAEGRFPAAPGRAISANARSLGGASDVGLSESSVSARLPIKAADLQLLEGVRSAAKGGSGQATAAYKSVKVVADNVVITGAGRNGGFFYNVYLNLPESSDSKATRQKYFLGTLGAFELAGVGHHGSATLEYPATEVLTNLDPGTLSEVTVSLVRVDGGNAPKGEVMHVGELRVELSTDEPFDPNPPAPRSPNDCYC